MPAPGEGLPDLWTPPPGGARLVATATVVAIGLHGLLALSLVVVDPRRFHTDPPIEIAIEEKLPPPEVKPPPPEDKPPPPEPRPRIVHRIPVAAPPPVPPPPSDDPPPKADDPPPTFGVSMNATTSGESSVAVPVGQTLMTKPAPKHKEAPLPSGDGTGGFVPVAEIYISRHPELIEGTAPTGEENYPPEAKRLGIEGAVTLKLGIDENGRVVQIKVIERAGHGFDEAAMKAMRKARFKPAVTSDGKAVPSSIPWIYRFESDR